MTQTSHRLNPYLALGLRRNPFILETSRTIAPTLWLDRGWSTPPAPQTKQFIQFLGVKGTGKTSHLQHWQAQTGGPYEYYPPHWGRLKAPPTGPITYWDEADRIPWPLLMAALGRGVRDRSTIVVGSHRNLALAAKLAGFTVKTVNIPPFDGPMLMQWASRRIKAAQFDHEPCRLQLTDRQAQKIAIAAQGSWREAADQLHIWAAQQSLYRSCREPSCREP
jgi:hypothetical protein